MTAKSEFNLEKWVRDAKKEASSWNYKFRDFVRDVAEFATFAVKNPSMAFPILGTITGMVASAFAPMDVRAAGAQFDSSSSDRTSNFLQMSADQLADMGVGKSFVSSEWGLPRVTEVSPVLDPDLRNRVQQEITYAAVRAGVPVVTSEIAVVDLNADKAVMARAEGRVGHDKHLQIGIFAGADGQSYVATRDGGESANMAMDPDDPRGQWEVNAMVPVESVDDTGKTVLTYEVVGARNGGSVVKVVSSSEGLSAYLIIPRDDGSQREVLLGSAVPSDLDFAPIDALTGFTATGNNTTSVSPGVRPTATAIQPGGEPDAGSVVAVNPEGQISVDGVVSDTPTVAPEAAPIVDLPPITLVTSREQMYQHPETLPDGSTRELRAAIASSLTAMYERGEIPPFASSVAELSHFFTSEPNHRIVVFENFYELDGTGPWGNAENRPMRGVTLVRGEGDVIYAVQMVKQAGTAVPGFIWYETTPEYLEYETDTVFNKREDTISLPIYMKTKGCVNFFGQTCLKYLDIALIEQQKAAMKIFVETGTIPPQISNGDIVFMMNMQGIPVELIQ